MKQVVLDPAAWILACQAGRCPSSVDKLVELSRRNTITLWTHPHAVSLVFSQQQDHLDNAWLNRMNELLEDVRLLPTTVQQTRQGLALAQRPSDDGKPRDLTRILCLTAARDYLEDFLLVGRESEDDFLGSAVLSPDDCLAVLGESTHEPLPFVDLQAQQHAILPALESNLFQVIRSCRFILGPEVADLERRLGDYVQTEHAVSCSSGTEALVLALLALEIGPGDAVFTTPFTFIATAGAICQVGAVPVFVDIDARTFNIDPNMLDQTVTALKTGRTGHPLPGDARQLNPKAVITVDLFGLPADHQSIGEVAAKHGLKVIEDAAQSFGGEERGQRACALAEIGCTSFFPAKPLGAYGEGGACFTNNTTLAEAMRSIRVHGQGTSRYEHARLGTNARLDSMQAAVLLAKLDVFPAELTLRAEKAAYYSHLFAADSRLIPPFIPEGFFSSWAQYSVLARSGQHRDACQQALRVQGIPTMVYYPIPLHLQRVFVPLGYNPGDFPVAEQTAQSIFSLPMHPYLRPEMQERVVSLLRTVEAV